MFQKQDRLVDEIDSMGCESGLYGGADKGFERRESLGYEYFAGIHISSYHAWMVCKKPFQMREIGLLYA